MVFWDTRGVIIMDYVQDLTGAYHASLLDKLKAEFVGKRPHLLKTKSVWPRQCAVSHLIGCHGKNPRITVWTTLVTLFTHQISSLKWIFLFPNLKLLLGGHRFLSNEEVITCVNNFCRERWWVLCGRVKEMRARLGEVCRLTWRELKVKLVWDKNQILKAHND